MGRVELQGGALLTPSFGKQNKLCWQAKNKVRVHSDFAEKGAFYSCKAKHMDAKPHTGKAEGNIMMLVCPSLGPDQGKMLAFGEYIEICVWGEEGGNNSVTGIYIAVLN